MGKPNREAVVKQLADLFERLGYTGAGMAQISRATGLGRGSLYHLFPDGKAQMMHEVLAAVEAEFHNAVIAPLQGDSPVAGIAGMFTGLLEFYRDGERRSIWGDLTTDPGGAAFHDQIRDHFVNWRGALTKALLSAGAGRGSAASMSERTISGVEGALTLAAGLDDTGALGRGLRTMSIEISLVIPKSKTSSQTTPQSTPTKSKTSSQSVSTSKGAPKSRPALKPAATSKPKATPKTRTAATPAPAKSSEKPAPRTAKSSGTQPGTKRKAASKSKR